MTTQSKSQKHRKQHISQRANSIQPSGIRKFFDLLSSIDGVISLGVGEPDYATPWHIRESAIESIEKGQTMYTSNSGMPELRKELARYLRNEYKVDYDPTSEILITVGCSEALDLTMRAIVDPGDEVIIPNPCFVAYGSCVTLAGGKPVHIPTYEANNFEISAKDIEKHITDKTRAILIGYPSNPTGAVMSRKKLADIAALALKYDLTVVSDEIYSKLVYGVEFTCFASLPEMKEHTVFLGGFSKAYAMTGWRIGYVCAPAYLMEGIVKVHQYGIMSAPTTAQDAALVALQTADADVEAMRAEYDRRRRLLVDGLNALGLSTFEPRGAFYAFPRITSTGLDDEAFVERLLGEEHVAAVPGSAFGPSGAGHVRMCYATSYEKLQEALVRIGCFVERVRVSG